jgi:Nucleotidyl transferase AbiEii toxin, Type IV TA system
VLDLYEELAAIVAALDERRIDYALCGGLAMAVWGFPRATVDIDIVIEPQSLDATEKVAESLGYTARARPMTFSSGAIVIHRISKIDPDGGDVLMLDMMLVTPAIANVWAERTRVEWEQGSISVVSRDGLIALKSFRASGRDQDDIALLREVE